MKLSTVVIALVATGVVGWIASSIRTNEPEAPTIYELTVVADPSELPSLSPSITPSPALQPEPSKGTYVPPKINSPNPTDPAAGGNTGGGYVGGAGPNPTGTAPHN